eukprot:426702-Pleurochrysis_carterae.AAC.1
MSLEADYEEKSDQIEVMRETIMQARARLAPVAFQQLISPAPSCVNRDFERDLYDVLAVVASVVIVSIALLTGRLISVLVLNAGAGADAGASASAGAAADNDADCAADSDAYADEDSCHGGGCHNHLTSLAITRTV